jgi:hypothetical protein
MASNHKLSKTTFTHGCQCPKHLYLHNNHRHLHIDKNPVSTQQTHIFDTGNSIGILAQQVFPGGVDCSPQVSPRDFTDSLHLTASCIASCQPVIYEAAFQTADGLLCALDILVHREDGWHGYEVKSTSQVKEAHRLDASFQYYVLDKCDVTLKSMNIMHLNKAYCRQEGAPIDVHALFVSEDVTTFMIQSQEQVQQEVQTQLGILDIEDCIPRVKIGPHCQQPYPCAFTDHCWKEAGLLTPQHNILQLTRGGKKKWDFLHEGIKTIADIPETYTLLSHDQLIQRECEQTKIPHIQHDELLLFTQCLDYPLYFLDFETVMPSVPLFSHTTCYQPICFQYSIHRRHGSLQDDDDDSSVDHFEYLAPTPGSDGGDADAPLHDIRIDFLRHLLLDIGTSGSILVYSSYERSRLRDMIASFPEHQGDIEAVIARLVDLAEPFRKKHYYHHDMQGSYSIKYVLPALVPELRHAYTDLDIGRGDVASNTFLSMITGSFKGDIAATRRHLLVYCQLDTWAMVKLLSKLIACCDEFYGVARTDLEKTDSGGILLGQGDDFSLPVPQVAADQQNNITSAAGEVVVVGVPCAETALASGEEIKPHPPPSLCLSPSDSNSNSSSQRLIHLAEAWQSEESEDNEQWRQSQSQSQRSEVEVIDSAVQYEKEIFQLHKNLVFDEKYANILRHNQEADIHIQNGRVQLQFRFNRSVIEAIKCYITNRTFDRDSKSWSCPLSSLNVAIKLYAFMGKCISIDELRIAHHHDIDLERQDRVITLEIYFPIITRNMLFHPSCSDAEEDRNSAFVLVTFDYDAEIVTAIKELDPYYRSYNPSKKEWKIHGMLLAELVEKLHGLNYESFTQQCLAR